ncbi:hypothetical protein S7711_00378 [Stachybotrys chartarum IBT 7711]|uniref:Folliculin-interacting protein N-terminal domain-containing protein n=1 Tax=Stachybotrys chartarum (strain CBS 109288 / IBT 7711) TaxID=1280523 RepID=A0A084B9J1_STACB|nr:hypothetical protein S7711_00378 [Stachybotrys chartarum IBT 7711]KFA55455.1 hypothetical protein S40293_02005 [Stachybotrys chartarum IBT 40293]KFA71514.1 hypothetical protein S40288_08631 [Stachybotrys chartarum IBT 40288]
MLGRLLHLGSGGSVAAPATAQAGSAKAMASLESVQEDSHTRNLLFPDAQALYQQRNDQVFPLSTTPSGATVLGASPFDFNEDVDLDVRDVRILIMQDTLGPTNTSLLFDSHPPPPCPAPERPTPDHDLRKTPVPPRKGSNAGLGSTRPVVIQPENPQTRQGAFDRRGSIHGRSQSYAETEAQRAAREYKDELGTFSSCIFGNSELMAYKGTSTKVHVVPVETRTATDHLFGDGRSSIGRASTRSSKLSQSYSSQAISPTHGPSLNMSGAPSRHTDKKKVLITRLFPVNLANDEPDPSITPHSRFSDESGGFPFPSTGDEGAPKKKKPQPKQRRTPMYAVVLVIQLPNPPSRGSSTMHPKAGFRESSSFNDQDFFPSSFSSTKLSGWNMMGSSVHGDTTESLYSVDVEDRIDSLTQHWDIIMRTLTHLQSTVATTIHALLKQADLASPGPYSPTSVTNFVARTPSWTERRSTELPRTKPPKSTTKLVVLLPNHLAGDEIIAAEVQAARNRIVVGLGAARVVTGQGRWGIWRDEAIWASRWAASLGQKAFFNNLLTGFLATHTDWVQALCPPLYRRRLVESDQSQKQNVIRNDDDLALPSRTIIVSDNKMVARRLIFLLSAFLPASQQLPAARTHRPSTSASIGAFSNSPPTYIIPILREESLRRKINRRTGFRRPSHSRTASQSTRTSAVPMQLAHLSIERSHERRVSDAASVRTANFSLAGASNDLVSRKSSAATTTTIVPETTAPHFSTLQKVESRRRPRPGSSGSVAADDLKRSLQRGDSSGHLSTTGSVSRSNGLKWGSIVSGLWNPRRRGSTDHSEYSQVSDLRSPVRSSFSRGDKLSEMVREVTVAEEEDGSDLRYGSRATDARDVRTPREGSGGAREPFAASDRTPDPTGAFESPVKTSINADDGIIDVDITFPDYITSLESAISSPSSSGYLSTPGFPGGLESFEHIARTSMDGDQPLNAAGWLSFYHPDFAIQAVSPRENLLNDIKKSLQAEPTPFPPSNNNVDLPERWVDVGSVMIADTTTQSVTRLLYRRLVRQRSMDKSSNGTSTAGPSFYGNALHTPSIAPYETQLNEEWIEDIILGPDGGLAEAVEKVVATNPDSGRETEPTSSQATSETRPSIDSTNKSHDTPSDSSQHAQGLHDAPRLQCKTVILTALEELIREVIEDRAQPGANTKPEYNARPNLLRAAVRDWINNLEMAAEASIQN